MATGTVEEITSMAAEIHSIATTSLTTGEAATAEKGRKSISQLAEKLSIATRSPAENAHFAASQGSHQSAIRIAIEMSLFDAVPQDGTSISTRDIALSVGADKLLVERLMRILSAIHVFSLRKPNYYAHNAYSRVFLNTDDCHLIRFVHDYTGPAVYWLPEFLAQSKFQNPQDYSKSAFQLAHRTDLGLWEFLKAVPHGTEVASHAMRSRIFAWQFQYSPYQFGEELGGAGMEEIVLVDVGGGRGQALEMVKTQHPTLTGRMVLQDLSGVIEEVTKAGLPAFIEPVAGSFFEPQPIKGAKAYLFSRIFHDWSDSSCLSILQNLLPSMDPQRSRVLISEHVLPDDRLLTRLQAMADLGLMGFAGTERTEAHWRDLLGRAGLEVRRIWRNEGETGYSVIEAWVK